MNGRIRRQNAGTARVGDNGDPIATRQRLIGHRDSPIEHFFDIVAPDDPRLPESRIANDIAARQRTGMRGRRGGPFFRPAGLENQNRLPRLGDDLMRRFH